MEIPQWASQRIFGEAVGGREPGVHPDHSVRRDATHRRRLGEPVHDVRGEIPAGRLRSGLRWALLHDELGTIAAARRFKEDNKMCDTLFAL